MRLAIAIAIASVRIARADGPITVEAGVGVTMQRWITYGLTSDSTDRMVAALRFDAAYHVAGDVSLGAHAGIATSTDVVGAQDFTAGTYRAAEVGASLQFAIHDRGWIAPWLGAIAFGGTNLGYWPEPMFAYGVDAGYDLTASDGHRFGALVAIAHGGAWTVDTSSYDTESFTSLTIGVAYRYR